MAKGITVRPPTGGSTGTPPPPSSGSKPTGTNGNDDIVGTSKAETIAPLLGHDVVNGGSGVDTLVIDYRSATPAGLSVSTITSSGATFKGNIAASGNSNDVTFSNIEKLSVKFDGGDNIVGLDGAALGSGATVDLDGGGGTDALQLLVQTLSTATTFSVDSSGKVTSNRGSFAGFERYTITLGSGSDTVTTGNGDDIIQGGAGNDKLSGGNGNDNIRGDAGSNTLNGGGGDDQLTTSGGVDKVTGGTGVDRWKGEFATSTSALTFQFNGKTGTGSLSNGTTLAEIERVTLSTGSGKDTFTITDGRSSMVIDGGIGVDALTVTNSGMSPTPAYSSISADGNGFYGTFAGSGDYSSFTSFKNIEKLSYVAGGGDDHVTVNAGVLAPGVSLTLDGGAGTDELILDLTGSSGISFKYAGGVITSTAPGTFRNFEIFSLILGNGNNSIVTGDGNDAVDAGSGNDTVSTGDGNDRISSGAGTDVIDAGAGDDTIVSSGIAKITGGSGWDRWNFNGMSASTPLAFTFDNGAGTITGGTTLNGVEEIDFGGGSGNDSFSIKGTGVFGVDGGAGTDKLTIDYSASDEPWRGTEIGSEAGSFYGSLGTGEGSTRFGDFENLVLKLSKGDDSVQVDPTALAAGATLSIDAGAGYDYLRIDADEFGDAVFKVDAAGKITSNLGSYANFEAFQLVSGTGDDEAVTADGDDMIADLGGTNTIRTGSGNDEIRSSGVDTVDGGEGTDSWWYRSDGTSSLIYSFDGNAASISNGSSAINVEEVHFYSGSGDDTFNVSGSSGSAFGGGAGHDILNASFSAQNAYGNTLQLWMDHYYGGEVNGTFGSSNSFDGFEELNITLDAGNSLTYLTFSYYAPGTKLSIDAGAGNDGLVLSLDSYKGAIDMSAASGGTVTSNLDFQLTGYEDYAIALGTGDDKVVTGAGKDWLYGGVGNDSVGGGGGDDLIQGAEGSDVIDGGAGLDRLEGGTGDDVLIGGAGGDFLIGNAGADTFRFDSVSDFGPSEKLDFILDFARVQGDRFDVSAIDAGAAAGDQAFAFVGTSAFAGSGLGSLRYEYGTDGSTVVQGDSDGDGSVDFAFQIWGHLDLAGADFIL